MLSEQIFEAKRVTKSGDKQEENAAGAAEGMEGENKDMPEQIETARTI